MRDALEEHLATRLGTLGETVGDDLVPPVDLELQVQRRRRRIRSTRRWSSAAIVAALVAVASGVAVIHGASSGRGSIQVAGSSTTAATVPAPDALQPGTVMLAARGRYVISLDANGRTNATMVVVTVGEVTYARATDDHRQLWYLSLKQGKGACGDVVRADIDRGNSSTIVTHAIAFDVSPDGSRLALYGGGDLAHGHCAPVEPGTQGRIVVIDLAGRASSSSVSIGSLASMRWSADGSYLATVSCASDICGGVQVFAVPPALGAPLTAESGSGRGYSQLVHSANLAVGSDGLYTLEDTSPFPGQSGPAGVRVDRIDPRASVPVPTPVFDGADRWQVTQVVPASTGTYLVAAPITTKGSTRAVGHMGLYRVVGARLVFVRSLDSPGTLTPVSPLPGG